MLTIDYDQMGFRLTLADAATVLEMSPEEVSDLVLCGELAALVLSEAGTGRARLARVRLHPDEVAAYDRRRRAGAVTADAHNVRRVRTLLREYLAARPPLDSYEAAILNGSPVRVATRRHGVVPPVNVSPEFVAAFSEGSGGFPIPASVVVRGLEALGAVPVKGWIALADRGQPGKQRWKRWYRLPGALTRPFEEHTVAASMLGRDTLVPEDRVTVSGGEPLVVETEGGGGDDPEFYDVDFREV